MKYHPEVIAVLTWAPQAGSGTVHGRQFDWGGLLPKSTEEREGTLSMVGNYASSVWVEECLTARPTSRADAKAGPNDPMV